MKRVVRIAAALSALGAAAWAEPGAWTFKDLGAGEGGQHYFVAQAPSDGTIAGIGNKREKAQLAIRCDPKGFYITVLWPDYVTAETYDEKLVDVDLTLDGGKPRRVKLHKVAQAGIALGREGFRLLKDVSGAKTLSVHLPDFHGGQDATFTIEGIGDIYTRVTAQGCGK